jgi:hypothetical protein
MMNINDLKVNIGLLLFARLLDHFVTLVDSYNIRFLWVELEVSSATLSGRRREGESAELRKAKSHKESTPN